MEYLYYIKFIYLSWSFFVKLTNWLDLTDSNTSLIRGGQIVDCTIISMHFAFTLLFLSLCWTCCWHGFKYIRLTKWGGITISIYFPKDISLKSCARGNTYCSDLYSIFVPIWLLDMMEWWPLASSLPHIVSKRL